MSDILVLGFTGRLIVQYLANHPQRSSFSFGIAARSQSKLDQLKKTLTLCDDVRAILINETVLEEDVKSAKVVINAIGPYWYSGEQVVRACALYGTHYVDLSGEPPWLEDMISKYDYLATKSGAIIVPACGLDSVPADLIVFLSNKTAKSTAGPAAGLGPSLSVYRGQGGFSGGTLASLMALAEDVPRDKLAEASQEYVLSPGKGKSRRRRLFYTVPFSSPTQYAMPWFMADPNRAIVQRTWGLHNASAASATTTAVSNQSVGLAYGPEFTYDECMVRKPATGVLGWLAAVAMSLSITFGMAVLFLIPPVRWLLKLIATPQGSGPSKEEMERGYLEITNYTSSVPAPRVPRVHVKSVMTARGDRGYVMSSVMISECALGLSLEKDALPAMAHGGGILTPAALGDVLVRRLEASGQIIFESHVVDPDEESRKWR